MPITPNGSPSPFSWRAQFDGPDGVVFQLDVPAGTQTEAETDGAAQSLINYLADWPELGTLTASKITMQNHDITPDGP